LTQLYNRLCKETCGDKFLQLSFKKDLGFDPLGIYPKDKTAQARFQLAEIKNGRLAMLAASGFAIQEAITSESVIDQSPYFFKPFFMV
jgi:hypothetical protein